MSRASWHKERNLPYDPNQDKRKQSLYFPEGMLNEMSAEAKRQDRSMSWLAQRAWEIAREQIMKFPSVDDIIAGR